MFVSVLNFMGKNFRGLISQRVNSWVQGSRFMGPSAYQASPQEVLVVCVLAGKLGYDNLFTWLGYFLL